ncbi:MAG: hypothetical protein RR178_07230, partial [Gordonibacter sp.]
FSDVAPFSLSLTHFRTHAKGDFYVKQFPAEWILPNYQGITPEAVAYFKPLIEGEPKLITEGGIVATLQPFNKR